jgi:hypothetical protein
MTESITLGLLGDAMPGRGIGQVLPHPGDPWLDERYIASAREYFALTGHANGEIPKPAAPSTSGAMRSPNCDARIHRRRSSISKPLSRRVGTTCPKASTTARSQERRRRAHQAEGAGVDLDQSAKK